jgi:hypothetical protein
MIILLSAIVVAGAVVFGCVRIAAELGARRAEAARDRTLQLLTAFAAAPGAAAADPRAVLIWEPLARIARQLFPADFEALDHGSGARFPFSQDRIQEAHSQWTADWLAWERAHDAEYKLKAAAAEEEYMRSEGSGVLRARLEAVEREKLELYQRRYAEYVRVAKALQALDG